MNAKFDELTKQMARSVTRRHALKKFGVGLAGIALACFGLADRVEARPKTCSARSVHYGSRLGLCRELLRGQLPSVLI